MEWMLMPLRRYAEFSGRSRRMEFWMWVLFQFLITCVFVVILAGLGGAALMSGDLTQLMAVGGVAIIIYLLLLLMALIFFIPNLAVTIRRLHDTDRSGWWVMLYWGPYLLLIVTGFGTGSAAAYGGGDAALAGGGMVALVAMLVWAVGAIILLVFMFLEGTRGPNRYGPDPKGQDTGQVFA